MLITDDCFNKLTACKKNKCVQKLMMINNADYWWLL